MNNQSPNGQSEDNIVKKVAATSSSDALTSKQEDLILARENE